MHITTLGFVSELRGHTLPLSLGSLAVIICVWTLFLQFGFEMQGVAGWDNYVLHFVSALWGRSLGRHVSELRLLITSNEG